MPVSSPTTTPGSRACHSPSPRSHSDSAARYAELGGWKRTRLWGPAPAPGATARGGMPETTIDRAGRRLSHSRSGEHTSELQSHHDIVCRLLREKKKCAMAFLAMCLFITGRLKYTPG